MTNLKQCSKIWSLSKGMLCLPAQSTPPTTDMQKGRVVAETVGLLVGNSYSVKNMLWAKLFNLLRLWARIRCIIHRNGFLTGLYNSNQGRQKGAVAEAEGLSGEQLHSKECAQCPTTLSDPLIWLPKVLWTRYIQISHKLIPKRYALLKHGQYS